MISVSDASKKQEGNRHARGLAIDNSRITNKVSTINIHFNIMIIICNFLHKEDKINHYEIVSSDAKTQYLVNILSSDCPNQPNCMPQCTEDECLYLCRHMITCTCYDYQQGHLCKHTHKVKCLQVQHQHVEATDQLHIDVEANNDSTT